MQLGNRNWKKCEFFRGYNLFSPFDKWSLHACRSAILDLRRLLNKELPVGEGQR